MISCQRIKYLVQASGGSKAVMLRGMCDLLLDLIYLQKNLRVILRKANVINLTPEIPQHHLSVTLNKTQETLGDRTWQI